MPARHSLLNAMRDLHLVRGSIAPFPQNLQYLILSAHLLTDVIVPCHAHSLSGLQQGRTPKCLPTNKNTGDVREHITIGIGVPFHRGVRLLVSFLEGNCKLAAIVSGARVSSLPGMLQTGTSLLRLWTRPHPEIQDQQLLRPPTSSSLNTMHAKRSIASACLPTRSSETFLPHEMKSNALKIRWVRESIILGKNLP